MNGLAAEVTASAATVQQAVDVPAALDKFHTFYSTSFNAMLVAFGHGVMLLTCALTAVGVVIPIITAWRQNAREAEFDKKLAASEKEIGIIRDQLLTKIAEVERAAESAAQARIADLTARLASAESNTKNELDRQVSFLKSFTLATRAESMSAAGHHAEAAHSAAAAIRELVASGRTDLLEGGVEYLRKEAANCKNPKADLGGSVIQNMDKALAKLSELPGGSGAHADMVRDVLGYIQGRLEES